ncbi:MAG: DUF1674 domain-containing protein [Rhizobiaceae bacterium]|nr:DUF1674 domain-containing protein [Rhizobiaceae bacterium]MBL4695487.1 DUF1674 domain-containing protein [Rhizobiaceae bacterium]MBL4731580.1 DUF1674 domain-containing protein [Rhizobiaceae bacterium]
MKKNQETDLGASEHPRQLPEAAIRALEEAKLRREKIDNVANSMPKEINGPKGLEPSRYGDWEKDGITSDF